MYMGVSHQIFVQSIRYGNRDPECRGRGCYAFLETVDPNLVGLFVQVCLLWCAEQIRVIERQCEIPHEGPFCDLMWSDPEDIETWAVSPRGAGWLFGARVTSEVSFGTAPDEAICPASAN